jgi:ATP-dependent RNA helicase DHX37/DHR1
VVRKGIDRLRKKHGEGSDSSSEEEVRGKGKGKAKEQVIDETVSAPGLATNAISEGGPTKGKKKKSSKQADWNPNLLSTQPDASSSEFDTSDSGNDTEPEAGPSTVEDKSKSRTPSPDVKPPVSIPARQPVASALKSVTTVAGGALKKGTNGTVVAPRIEVRRKQRLVSSRLSRLHSHKLMF